MTELGLDATLLDFGLAALPKKDYKVRTLKNVPDADGTVIYGDLTGGTRLTVEYCKMEKKPYTVNPSPGELFGLVRGNTIGVLNVAGNRASKLSPKRLEGYGSNLGGPCN
jgi:hypothetical protein